MPDRAALEPVGGRSKPVVWIGVWLVVFAAVLAVAVIGPRPTEWPSAPNAVVAGVTASTGPTSAAAVPATTASTVPLSARARLRPFPARPPLGEDGLVGGLVFGSAWTPD